MRRTIVAAVIAILLLGLWLGLFARTPKGRMNVAQSVAALFFLMVFIRRSLRDEPTGTPRSTASFFRGPWPALILPAALYASTLGVAFLSDDYAHLTHARQPLWATITTVLRHGQGDLHFRPLGLLSLYIDYRVWHQWAPGFHLVNLLLHLATAVGVFSLCKRLAMAAPTSTTAAVVFSILPIHPEAVVWPAARFDLLAAFFTISSMVLYLKARNGGRRYLYGLSLAIFLLALLSKESAYVLPLLLVVLEFSSGKARPFRWVVGFALLAVIMLGYRLVLFRGVGGYLNQRGKASVLDVGPRTLEGLFLRGPAQSLLGVNWLEPSGPGTIAIFSMTAAVLLTLAATVRRQDSQRTWIRIGTAWLVLASLPVHHLLLIGPGLTNSRVLYLGSVGVAIIIANALAAIRQAGPRRCWTVLCISLLSLSLLHNLHAWRWTGDLSRRFLVELCRVEPSPPPQAEFVLYDMPDTIRGVFFFRIALSEAVQMKYGRLDLTARRATGGSSRKETPGRERPTINIHWTGDAEKLIEPVED